MTISLRTIALVGLALAAGAVGMLVFGGSPAEPAATAAAPAASHVPAPAPRAPDLPIATVAGSEPGTKATLLSLRRTGAKVVTVRLRLSFDSTTKDVWIPWQHEDHDRELSAEEMRLVDEVNGREHFVLRNADGRCLCSGDFQALERGESSVVSAKFPAPPANVRHASLETPGFPSFDAVPLS